MDKVFVVRASRFENEKEVTYLGRTVDYPWLTSSLEDAAITTSRDLAIGWLEGVRREWHYIVFWVEEWEIRRPV